jgi:hypothetical protein
MAAIDLTTWTDCSKWLGKDGQAMPPTDDTLGAQLVTAASRFLLQLMNRDSILATARTETFKGFGGCDFVPRNTPVISITSVQVGSTVIAAGADIMTNQSGFYLVNERDVDVVKLLGYEFLVGSWCKVVYQAGFATVPEDIAQACKELVALRYRDRKHIGLLSENIMNGAGTMYDVRDMSPFTKSVIEQYKAWW